MADTERLFCNAKGVLAENLTIPGLWLYALIGEDMETAGFRQSGGAPTAF